MQTARGKGHALGHPRSHLRLWLAAGVGLLVDLATKYAAWHALGPPSEPGGQGVPHAVLPGWLRLVTSENPGIVFGFDFARRLGLGAPWGVVLTVLLTVLTCVFVFYVFAGSGTRHRWLHASCGLVLAGALGNLYDRLLYGHVRDFIQITRELTLGGRTLGWPYVFNVADVLLVVGVAGVLLVSLFGGSGARQGPRDQAQAERKRGGS